VQRSEATPHISGESRRPDRMPLWSVAEQWHPIAVLNF